MVLLVALALLGGVAFVGFFCFVLLIGSNSAGDQAEDDAPAILDRAFDGREEVVVTLRTTSLPYEDVVIGAERRGYTLASQSEGDRHGDQTLLFERVAD